LASASFRFHGLPPGEPALRPYRMKNSYRVLLDAHRLGHRSRKPPSPKSTGTILGSPLPSQPQCGRTAGNSPDKLQLTTCSSVVSGELPPLEV